MGEVRDRVEDVRDKVEDKWDDIREDMNEFRGKFSSHRKHDIKDPQKSENDKKQSRLWMVASRLCIVHDAEHIRWQTSRHMAIVFGIICKYDQEISP